MGLINPTEDCQTETADVREIALHAGEEPSALGLLCLFICRIPGVTISYFNIHPNYCILHLAHLMLVIKEFLKNQRNKTPKDQFSPARHLCH